MNILIITGGSSSERKISLISANAVALALRRNGHRAKPFDFRKGYPALTKILPDFDAVFPVMHGKEGEDGTLYKFLRVAKKPYVGSEPRGARIAFDKISFKRYCDRHRLPTAAWRTVRKRSDIMKFGFPSVLKAANGGSSQEVALLCSEAYLNTSKVRKILELDDALFVESLLRGVEITVGVLNGRALPVVEIVPPQGGWFDYKNKYSGDSRELPFAPSVEPKVQRLAQRLSLRIHRELKLGSYSRTDFIVSDGKPVLLETNTPGGVGLTPQSLLPKAAQAAGISFDQLVEKMLPKPVIKGYGAAS